MGYQNVVPLCSLVFTYRQPYPSTWLSRRGLSVFVATESAEEDQLGPDKESINYDYRCTQ